MNKKSKYWKLALLWVAAIGFVLGLNVLQHEAAHLSLAKTSRKIEQGLVEPSPAWAVGEFKTAARNVIKAGRAVLTTPHPGEKELASLPALKLYVPQSGLYQLNRDLPVSGRSYVRAEFAAGGKRYRAKVKYRGDNIYHWGTVQKSWRVRLRKGYFHDGMRAFNLINPFALTVNDPLVWEIGQRMGGLHLPKSYPVNVFLNGNYLGVFSLVEQINEYWARQKGLLPGDIYYGEGMWSKELHDRVERMQAQGVPLEEIKSFRRTRRILWNTSSAWDKNSSVSSDTEGRRVSPRLEELLETVREPDEELFHARIWDLIDREMVLRSIALHLILDSRHTDDFHNWKLYLNPYRARFEPILWNLNPLIYYDKELPDRIGVEGFGQLLYDRALSDPLFLSDLCKFLDAFVRRDLTPTGLVKVFDQLVNQVRPSVRADEYKDQWKDKRISPLSNQEFERVVTLSRKRLIDNLRKVMIDLGRDEAALQVEPNPEARQGDLPLRLLIRFKSKAGLELKGLVLRGLDPGAAGEGLPQGWRVYLDRDDDGEIGPGDPLLNLSPKGEVLPKALLLLANRSPVVFDEQASDNRKLYQPSKTLPTHLRLLLIEPGGMAGEPGETIRPLLVNRATGERVSPEPWSGQPGLQDSGPMNMEYAAPNPQPRERMVLDRGLHRIEEDRVYGKNTDLVIKAGAILELEPGVSIICRGGLKVEGTKEERVIFRPAGPEPWGVLAVQSPKETVVIKHLRLMGGSEDDGHPVYYSGMLSVYDGDLDLRDSTLESNFGEDGLNVKGGQALVSGCLFSDLRGDAIDFDLTEGRVERSVFRMIRNDAIDFGGSEGSVENVLCSGIGDKSVSVGEGSRVTVTNLVSCCADMGVAVKDESEALVRDSLFIANREDLPAYRKNLHFAEAGRISADNPITLGRDNLERGGLGDKAELLAGEVLTAIHGKGSPLIRESLDELAEPLCLAR